MKQYEPGFIAVESRGVRPATWSFVKSTVSGNEHEYEVTDRNYSRNNRWTFVVRVPNDGDARIEVRPIRVPNQKAWANLERRSLTFVRATQPAYRDRYYCQLNLADATGMKTKNVISWGKRAALPPWLQGMRHRMRLKRTVKRTNGNDGNQQVVIVCPADHERMIRIFFATKVWVLKERVVLGT